MLKRERILSQDFTFLIIDLGRTYCWVRYNISGKTESRPPAVEQFAPEIALGPQKEKASNHYYSAASINLHDSWA